MSGFSVQGHVLDINRALMSCGDGNHATVVLCHQPRGVRQLLQEPGHTIDLVLAGEICLHMCSYFKNKLTFFCEINTTVFVSCPADTIFPTTKHFEGFL